MPLEILVVIPAYNEGDRLPRYLEELCKLFQTQSITPLFYIVDDGSNAFHRNKLEEAVSRLKKEYPRLNLQSLPKNIGKGGAIRAGWKDSKNFDWIAFLDADGAIPAYEVLRVIQMLSPKSPSIFTCRIKMLGRKIERHLYRHLMGRVFATLTSILFKIPVYDSQCGFKLIRRSSYEKIELIMSENGFVIDVELMILLMRTGESLQEIPVDWKDIPGSKVSLIIDPFKMILSLIRLHYRN